MISVPNVTKSVPNVMIVPFCYTLLGKNITKGYNV